MNLNRVIGAVLPFSFLIFQPLVNASTLITGADTPSTYFMLDGGGGGLQSTLNGQSLEIFCVDYANDIAWSTNYTVDVTSLTSGNLSLTRFGAVTNFNDNFGGTGVAVDSTDQATLNNTESNPTARYDMAAYLITQYQLSSNPSNSAYNDGIQQAIWDLLDPVGDTATLPNIGNPTSALEAAAQWYSNPESNKSFLSNFVIISDPSMTTCSPSQSGALCGGFQEQMALLPTPEPRGQAFIILALLAAGGLLARRFSQRARTSEKTVC